MGKHYCLIVMTTFCCVTRSVNFFNAGLIKIINDSQNLHIHVDASNWLSSQNNNIVSVPQAYLRGWSFDHWSTDNKSLA